MSRKLAEGRSFFMCSHGFPSSLCSLPLSVPGANIVKRKVKSEVMRETGTYLKTGRNGEGGRERQMAGGRLVLSWGSACRHAEVRFHCHFYSLSSCFYSLSSCHLLSITFPSSSVTLLYSSSSLTLSVYPLPNNLFLHRVVHLKHCQINTCRCPRDSIDSPLIYEWERSNHSYDVYVGMNDPLGVYISYSI